MIKKKTSFHHSVTENGEIQVRVVAEYQDENGNVINKKYGEPMTVADTGDLTGWDDRSKEIVAVIIDPGTKIEFEAEKQVMTGSGLEEVVTHDRVIDSDGRIAVRRITRIFDEGVEVSKKFHRSWILPGDTFGKADIISRAIAKKLHTQQR